VNNWFFQFGETDSSRAWKSGIGIQEQQAQSRP